MNVPNSPQENEGEPRGPQGRREFIRTAIFATLAGLVSTPSLAGESPYQSDDEIMRDKALSDAERLEKLEQYWKEQAEKVPGFAIHHYIDYREYAFAEEVLKIAIENDSDLKGYRVIMQDTTLSDTERNEKLLEFWKSKWPSTCIKHFAVFRESSDAGEIMTNAAERDYEAEAVDPYTIQTFADEWYAKDVVEATFRSHPDAVIERFEGDEMLKMLAASLRTEAMLQKALQHLVDHYPYLLFIYSKHFKGKPYEGFLVTEAFKKCPRVFVGSLDEYLEKPYGFALAEQAAHDYPAEFYWKIASVDESKRALLRKSRDPVVLALIEIYDYKFSEGEKVHMLPKDFARDVDKDFTELGFANVDREKFESIMVPTHEEYLQESTSSFLDKTKTRMALLVDLMVSQFRSVQSLITVASSKKIFTDALHDLQAHRQFIGQGSVGFAMKWVNTIYQETEFKERETHMYLYQIPKDPEERQRFKSSYEDRKWKGEPVHGAIPSLSLHEAEEMVFDINNEFTLFPKARAMDADDRHVEWNERLADMR